MKTLTAQLPGPQVRRVLRDRTYIEIRGDHAESRELAAREVLSMLRNTFGLDVPKGAKFRAMKGAATRGGAARPAKSRR